MRVRLLVIFMFISLFGVAQLPVNNQWWLTNKGQSFVGVSGGFSASSAQFSNAFAASLFFDDVLPRDMIDVQNNRLDPLAKNLIGLDYEISIAGGYRIKNSAHTIAIKLADAGHAHGKVTQDVFSVAFNGNKQYAGDTLSFSGSKFQGMRYQTMGLGWQYSPTDVTSFFAMASFVNGEQMAEANVDRANIYTSALGDTIHADVLGNYAQSDTGQIGFLSPNGGGLSIDLGFRTVFSSVNSNWELQMAVYDLGAMQWQTRTIKTEIDTVVTWTGVALPELQDVNQNFTDRLTDSLEQSINGLSKKGKLTRLLPGTFHASMVQQKTKGAEFGGGTILRWNAEYNPYAYLVGGYQFNEKLESHAHLGYGGYGTVQFGVEGNLVLDHFYIGLRLSNLEALVLTNQFAGAAARVNLQYLF